MKRIDKIIKKAECIKKFLTNNGKEMGNIDGLIKNLESYRDNVGDIGIEKVFFIGIMGRARGLFKDPKKIPFYCSDTWSDINRGTETKLIGIRAIEFTEHIHDVVRDNIECESIVIYSMPPMVLYSHVADAVFDVQTFPVDDVALSVELINAGFRPTKTNVRWICDFEIND